MNDDHADEATSHVATTRRGLIKGMLGGAATAGFALLRPMSPALGAEPAAPAASGAADPLPSWTDGAARRAIMTFLDAVVDPANAGYVRPEDRVAAFDNDGTLWCEKPLYAQLDFMLRVLYQRAQDHPELRTVQPYKAAWEKDSAYFNAIAEAASGGDTKPVMEFLGAVLDSLAGLTPAEYEAQVRAFFDAARHARFQVPYQQTIYQPMVELIRLLQARQFDVYMATGGGRDFMRVVSEQIYGLSRAHIIGSSVDLAYEADAQGGRIVRQKTLTMPYDDGPGKPVHIEMQVGRQPVVVGGNSDGDVQMLLYGQEQRRPFLGLLVRHDDAAREYAYDTGAEQALQLAATHQWTVISMKGDFKTIFPSG